VVHGGTSPGATVTINGAAASVATDGEFRAEVALAPGDNTIEVVAVDASGDRKSVVLTVVSLIPPPQPFILVVTEPRDQSIVSEATVRLSGRTGTDAIVTVQGVGVAVDALGVFSTTVTLDQGPNVIDVVAADIDGRVLSTVIAIIYRPPTGG
jgi:bacillopeptidase F